MPHIFALHLLRELKVMAPRITAVQRTMVLFSRKYGCAFYRDIANECGFLNLLLPEYVCESPQRRNWSTTLPKIRQVS